MVCISVSSGEPYLQPKTPLEPDGSRSQNCVGISGGRLFSFHTNAFNAPLRIVPNTLGQLRKDIKQKRSSLTEYEKRAAASDAFENTIGLSYFTYATRVAFYIAANGELDPMPVLEKAVAMQKECYLPILRPMKKQSLWFGRWFPGDKLERNRYDIAEPQYRYNKLIPAWALDLVLTPLVAFDSNGNRLGMGGGFYDRSFSYLKQRMFWRKPVMAGYAYEFQNAGRLHTNAWDVPLNLVITEKKIHYANPKDASSIKQ